MFSSLNARDAMRALLIVALVAGFWFYFLRPMEEAREKAEQAKTQEKKAP